MGPRDVEQGGCVVARRDVPGKEGKQFGVPLEPAAFVAHVQGLLEEVQGALLAQARAFRDANIVDVTTYEELQAAVAEGACGGLLSCRVARHCGGWVDAEAAWMPGLPHACCSCWCVLRLRC